MQAGRWLELGIDDRSYGEVLHLPVGPPVTVDEMVEFFNEALGTCLTALHMPSSLLDRLADDSQLFKDVREMNYQFETDYVLSDQKFRSLFPDFEVTPYREAVKAMADHFAGLREVAS